MKPLSSHILRLAAPALNQSVNMATSSAQCERLQGKVAVVTASTEGIGLSIARRLAQEGATVMISSRKQQNVDRALAELRKENLKVSGMVCHVGKEEHRKQLIEQTVKEHGGIDVLVSNAAVNPSFGPIMNTKPSEWDKIFDINVKASFYLCQEAVPHMEKRGGGSLVFVSSIGGYVPFEMLGPYSVSKTALLGLVKAMAPQLVHNNIRVNGIAPGLIKTKFSGALWQSPEVEKEAVKGIPMGRIGHPDECAGAVAFLVSDDASFITGETIIMSGGAPARL